MKISYTEAQNKIFFETPERFVTVAKGRRFGFTRGAASFMVEELLDGRSWLWVDTVNSNIQRYFERYFQPILKELPSEIWSWSKQDKKLIINGVYLDMRSADNPENIEGFGYYGVLLNEAGIILKNRYLWENAIRPMLLDNSKSRAIVGGVPKGKNLFYELAQKGIGGDKDWAHLQFTSYDNPFLNADDIQDLESELGNSPQVIRQEIYGEFVDNTTNELIPYGEILKAVQRQDVDGRGSRIWGVDVARFGDDSSVIAMRSGYYLEQLHKYQGLDTIELANKIYGLYNQAYEKPHGIFVETNGIGAGLYDLLNSYGLPVLPADVAESAESEICFNKRMEMYWELSRALPNMHLPDDKTLSADLSQIEYFYTNNGKMQLESKKELKKRLGRSPDSGDAVALTFFRKVFVGVVEEQYWGAR
jgi:hypothetical protein